MGGELVDSTHFQLLKLSAQVGLKPIDTWEESPGAPAGKSGTEQQQYCLNNKTGKLYANADFLTPHGNPKQASGLFVDLAREIRRDYEEMGRTGDKTHDWLGTPLNKKLDSMSVAEYLDEKCRKLASQGKPVDPALLQMLENGYQCENGRELGEIPALLFVNQIGQGASGAGLSLTEGFSIYGASDERYVIPGGTAALIEKLRIKSEEIAQQSGFPAPIQLDRTLQRIEQMPEGKTRLHFVAANGTTSVVDTDYVISALQAPALGRIPGVENLGLTAGQIAELRDLQFTHTSKVFFEVEGKPWEDFTATGADGKKARITDSDGCFFGDTIKECWPTGDGELTAHGTTWITCLVGGKENDKYSSPKKLIEACKQEYARILSKDPSGLFISSGDGKPLASTILAQKAAGGGIGCYCSPGVGQAISSTKLSQELSKGTSRNGKPVAGFAGSWLATVSHAGETPNIAIGFLDNGVETAVQASQLCAKHVRGRSKKSLQPQKPILDRPAVIR
jgi:hypothetical protein